jgi:hypothetical protein
MPPRRSPDVTYEVVDGRAMLIDAAGTEIITLNPVGSLVWTALDGKRDVAALADHLLPELQGVSRAELERDIADFASELAASNLIIGDDQAFERQAGDDRA